jgi:hypothetical protein
MGLRLQNDILFYYLQIYILGILGNIPKLSLMNMSPIWCAQHTMPSGNKIEECGFVFVGYT